MKNNGPKLCVNGDSRPVQAPSKVLCKECLDDLDRNLDNDLRTLLRGLGVPEKQLAKTAELVERRIEEAADKKASELLAKNKR